MSGILDKDITFISKLFAGRVTRTQYWFSTFKIVIATTILMSLTIAGTGSTKGSNVSGTLLLVILAFAAFFGFVSSVKRCHDRNRSGWLMLLSWVPFLNIWLLIELGFLRGTNGENQFGPDPLPTETGSSFIRYRQAREIEPEE